MMSSTIKSKDKNGKMVAKKKGQVWAVAKKKLGIIPKIIIKNIPASNQKLM